MIFEVLPNTPVATGFVDKWHDSGSCVTTAISPDSKILDSATFCSGEKPKMADWIDARQGVENQYFHPASLRRAFSGSERPSKNDVVALPGFWADYDPPNPPPGVTDLAEHTAQHRAKVFSALMRLSIRPTVIVRSGGGVQAFWKLEKPFIIDGDPNKAKQAEKINTALKDVLKAEGIKGDSVQSVEHLMRLPGTINIPDEKKRKKGRETVTACIFEEDWGRRYSPDSFLAWANVDDAPPPAPAEDRSREIIHIQDLDDLDEYGIDARDKAVAIHGVIPDVPKLGDNSRSAAVHDVACNYRRKKVPRGKVAWVLLNPNWGVSESILEGRSPEDAIKEAWRQIEHAEKRIAEEAAEKPAPDTAPSNKQDKESKTPTQYAQIMIAARKGRLIRFNGEWLSYVDGAYQAREDEGIRAEVWKAFPKATLGFVSNVLAALNALVHHDKNQATAPCWLDGRTGPSPNALLVLRNGILDLHANTLLPLTDQLFTRNALDFDFDPGTREPKRWLQFLSEVWPDDPDSIAALQMAFGYLLSIDTAQQKIFVLVGPPRCGKGTVGRVLAKLLGQPNMCAPTFSMLGSQFGLQGMIGKQLALVSDMRIGKMTDRAAIAESLLRISGEDPVSIPRKNREDWDGQLKVRFVIMANEPPTLDDPSGALLARYIIFQLRQSFLGREDHSLDSQLETELPGILNWALDGWRALRLAGRLKQPRSAEDLIESISRTSSPVAAFVTDECVLATDAMVVKDELYVAFKDWCRGQDREWNANKEVFSKTLITAFPDIKPSKARMEGDRKPVYRGIALRKPSHYVADELDLGPAPF